ncbi:MAG: DNA methyltransferase [Clostridiales bacterium]|nr:DNA methyltransferase [Clostridiales bacterium]
MNERLERFTTLMKQIFELDKSDLDFGIYRIMNIRKAEIEKFLTEGLPEKVRETLAPFASQSGDDIKAKMAEIENSVAAMGVSIENLPETAPMVVKYRELQKQLAEGADLAGLETDVYSALYSFFNRYYEDGDFVSKRRYKEGVYAIPYEGEEVKLYWANQDQYYIKTSENFKDYTFVVDEYSIHFRLVDATTEQNNNKESADSKRTFMLFTEDAENYPGIKTFEYLEDTKELIIRFIFDIPEDKKKKYAEENYEKIRRYVFDNQLPMWNDLLAPIPTGKDKQMTTLLEKHLKGYVAKNTFDYFIHKDLRGFLTRELDFYIKSEIMHLDDLDTENEARVETYLAKIKAIKRVGKVIIDFLAQIEDFQKKLWLKKKFVVETNWCITLDKIDESFWAEIIANKAQIDEWIAMYAIDEAEGWSNPPTIEFLRSNQNLLLDTKHFPNTFKSSLLESIPDLDSQTNGLMINSDNYQALNTIKQRYRNKVQCIYIDPPYNTDATPILYKNGYKDSSWMSLMHDRILSGRELLDPNIGYYSVAIDDAELHNLYQLMEMDLSPMELLQVIVNHYPGSGTGRSNVSKTHEYNIFAIPNNADILRGIAKDGGERIRGFCRSGTGANNYRYGRPNSFYAVLVDPTTHEIKGFETPPSMESEYPKEPTKEGYIRIYPLGADGSERCWSLGYESAIIYNERGMLECTPNNVIRRKYYDEANRELLPSLWIDTKFSAVVNGTNLLTGMFGQSGNFTFPKSLYTVLTAIEAGLYDEPNATVVDFFAGSGTTGHAVLELNKADDGERKYVLVEMGEYFEAVTKARMMKAIYSSSWKNGKPIDRVGTSHIMKYMRLESYEDALSNIELANDNNQLGLLFGEDYLINYMLDLESKGSILNLDGFNDPFSYRMKITEKNECKERPVDLCETFNYLIGLTVSSQSAITYFASKPSASPVYEGAVDLFKDANGDYAFRQIEGTLPDGRRALVIWRTVTDNLLASNAALDAYFLKYRINPLDREYDVIYVNGDSNLENLRTANESWKVQMTEIEFKKRMFEEV